MLKHLYIKNYALIDELDIAFDAGFSVITGETGAGKSIILGAIGVLLGQRADSKAVKTNTQKCTIEAHFDISRYDMEGWFEENELDADDIGDCIIRRELTAVGKSRGFINDTPVTLTQMRDLGEMLIDVHSQHQNLLLQKEDFQLNVLDIIAQNTTQHEAYVRAFREYSKASNELKALQKQITESQDNMDFMRFQLEELEKAALAENEQEELEEEQERASHTEDIKTALYEADGILNNDETGALDALRTASSRLSSAAALYPKLQELAERMEAAYIEVKDVASEIGSECEDLEFDPARLAFINERLDIIYTLLRKYQKDSIAGLLEEQKRLSETIANIDNSDEALAKKTAEVAQLLASATAKAEKLTATRQKVAAKIEKEIVERLGALGMPNVAFKVNIEKDDTLGMNGQDRVAFLFSANKGMAMRPVAQVASGGEIARLMLSLKAMISGAVKLPTIIFDEIDTGVSGRVAEKMADIMKQMGEAERQVLSITHLPQIAAMGTHHYKVEKHDTEEGTISIMRRLSKEERIDEIAQMLSGSDITDAARENARTLLGL